MVARKQDPKKGGYVVYEGEALPEIAADLGVPLEGLRDANTALKERVNLLAPGEDVVKPLAPKKNEVRANTGAKAKAEVKTIPRVLRLCLKDSAGKPLKSLRCSFKFDVEKEKDFRTETTDGAGKLILPLPEEAASTGTGRTLTAQLKVGAPPAEHLFELRVRFLRPLDAPSTGTKQLAVEQRLRNLGYAVHDPAPDPDAATHVALACFQADQNLQVTGNIDDQTLAALKGAHGC